MLTQSRRFIFLGMISGLLTVFSKATLSIFMLFIVSICFMHNYFKGRDRIFLVSIFTIGFLMRVAFSLLQDAAVFFFVPNSVASEVINPNPIDNQYPNIINERVRVFLKTGDSDYASIRGYMFAEYARGVNNKVINFHISRTYEYGWHGYLYVIGLFYYLFGYSPISVKFINCFIGALIPIFVFLICTNFNRTAARIASFLTMFFPSLILWSTTNLKDESVVLLSIIMVFFTLKFIQERRQYRSLIVLGICAFLQSFLLKRNMWVISIIFLLIAATIYVIIKVKWKMLFLVIPLALYLLIPCNLSYKRKAVTLLRDNIHVLCMLHHGHVGTPGVSYKIFDSDFYKNPYMAKKAGFIFFVRAITRGLYHFIYEPLPSRMLNMSFLSVYPQMLLWYCLLPFILFGILNGLRNHYIVSLVVLIYLSLITFTISLGSGNVGTLFRHRDLVTPFYLIFAGIGLADFMRKYAAGGIE